MALYTLPYIYIYMYQIMFTRVFHMYIFLVALQKDMERIWRFEAYVYNFFFLAICDHAVCGLRLGWK